MTDEIEQVNGRPVVTRIMLTKDDTGRLDVQTSGQTGDITGMLGMLQVAGLLLFQKFQSQQAPVIAAPQKGFRGFRG